MDRRSFMAVASATLVATQFPPRSYAQQQRRKKGLMLFDRIGPTKSELYTANADGSAERLLLEKSVFDYHARFAGDGRSIVFTSEREGLGQADICIANPDGTGIRRLTDSPNVDDQGVLSPDGSTLAFVSTRDGFRANVWTLHLKSGQLRNLTGGRAVQGDPSKPDGFFRPSWSPDSQWLAFSSDRNTDWRGHHSGAGWEHTQQLSIYLIRADGTGFRRLAGRPDYCLGTPRWSPDGKRVIFYEMTVENTWDARRPEGIAGAVSQLVSADFATGERFQHTTGPGIKIFPQFLSAQEIAYHRKGGPDEGLYYTSGKPAVKRSLRSPAWSPDGAQVIYEKVAFRPAWPQGTKFYSWDPDWDYAYSDTFPNLSPDGKQVIFSQNLGNGSIGSMNPDGSNSRILFAADGKSRTFQPVWSRDGQWIAFGYGRWFQERVTATATLMRVRADGSGAETLTDGKENVGFPSWSPDGKRIVYRVWGMQGGLRIIDVADRSIKVLTNEDDNLPDWHPDGNRIVFTRKIGGANFDVFTIRPDGSDLHQLTDSGANDGHAVWSADGKRIYYTSGMYGFKDEAALYDNTFQPYGGIFVMNADGSGKHVVTDSPWEDAQPLYVPAA